jgi:uncharacterized protein (TIGR02145 family)
MKIKIIRLFILILFCIGLTGCKTNSLKDKDGNIYKTVTIGTQAWMAENLKTTKYNDGSSIPLVMDDKTWETSTSPAFCWYKNDATTNKNTYGALYNWYTVNTKKLCPKGWHVSTHAEWTTLTNYLKGDSVAGGKLKEMGTVHWESPNTGATNQSGFTALPGGYRYIYGAFYLVGYNGAWWSSTESDAVNAWSRYIGYFDGIVSSSCNFSKRFGYSVRCVKDN